MKVVVAPNAFKGSLSATEAASAMAEGVQAACSKAEVVCMPVADGGDGLIEILREVMDGEVREIRVSGPRGDPVEASLLYVAGMGVAVIEMATASGLVLLPETLRNPMETTTLGTGELIRAALDLGVRRIIVGIGGSASNDGGTGVAAALGLRFLDESGHPVHPVGKHLRSIRRVDMSGRDPRLDAVRIEVMCDVDNPLLGEHGAARVYGPQKGASPEQVEVLEAGLENLARVIETRTGTDVRDMPGAGAAGGLGAGLVALLGARLRRGIDVVLDLVGLDDRLVGADLVLTAEGQIDFQTAHGKAPAGVAERAKRRGIPCFAVAGGIGERISELHPVGVDAVFSICKRPMSLREARDSAHALLGATTEQVVRAFVAGCLRSGPHQP